MEGRQQRGLQIAASGTVTGVGNAWHVPSQTRAGARAYRVNPYAGSCTCPDHEGLNLRCKHLWAVLVTMEIETSANGTDVTQTSRVTYSQEWSSYNRAQVEEKDTFMRLFSDLCAGSNSPARAKGVLPSPCPIWPSAQRSRSTVASPRAASPRAASPLISARLKDAA